MKVVFRMANSLSLHFSKAYCCLFNILDTQYFGRPPETTPLHPASLFLNRTKRHRLLSFICPLTMLVVKLYALRNTQHQFSGISRTPNLIPTSFSIPRTHLGYRCLLPYGTKMAVLLILVSTMPLGRQVGLSLKTYFFQSFRKIGTHKTGLVRRDYSRISTEKLGTR